ncbi:MAG: hypothetical protein JWR20_1905 [Marmoricola sp.]|jgi:hypothetical protein|nr:hypothetical protein [Marmoricola sp.]
MSHSNDPSSSSTTTSSPALIALAWLIVLVPLAYGLWQTLVKAAQLLGG